MFWRVHRNAIVRVSAIRNVKPDEDGRLQLWLDGLAEPINVSESFRHKIPGDVAAPTKKRGPAQRPAPQ